MIFVRTLPDRMRLIQGAALVALAMTLGGCVSPDVDDPTGSHLAQPPAGTAPRQPLDADDIAIVGQEVAHAILALPAVADATVPPRAQFAGVTSIVTSSKGVMADVDTEPYTTLLRDRILLLTRLKLRFIEHTLPPLVTAKRGKKTATPTSSDSGSPDYKIVAELRGRLKDPFYHIQVQFVAIRTGEVLFDGLYRIRKEGEGGIGSPASDLAPDQSAPAPDQSTGPAPSNIQNPNVPDPTYVPPPAQGGSGTIY